MRHSDIKQEVDGFYFKKTDEWMNKLIHLKNKQYQAAKGLTILADEMTKEMDKLSRGFESAARHAVDRHNGDDYIKHMAFKQRVEQIKTFLLENIVHKEPVPDFNDLDEARNDRLTEDFKIDFNKLERKSQRAVSDKIAQEIEQVQNALAELNKQDKPDQAELQTLTEQLRQFESEHDELRVAMGPQIGKNRGEHPVVEGFKTAAKDLPSRGRSGSVGDDFSYDEPDPDDEPGPRGP